MLNHVLSFALGQVEKSIRSTSLPKDLLIVSEFLFIQVEENSDDVVCVKNS